MRVIELGEGESVMLAAGVILTVMGVQTSYARLGIVAPASVPISRPEAKRKAPRPGRRNPKEFHQR